MMLEDDDAWLLPSPRFVGGRLDKKAPTYGDLSNERNERYSSWPVSELKQVSWTTVDTSTKSLLYEQALSEQP